MKRLTVPILIAALVLVGGIAWAQSTLVYGTTDKVTQMDPASAYDFHTWELFHNVNEGPAYLQTGYLGDRPWPGRKLYGQHKPGTSTSSSCARASSSPTALPLRPTR